jgi:hypothetical protein
MVSLAISVIWKISGLIEKCGNCSSSSEALVGVGRALARMKENRRYESGDFPNRRSRISAKKGWRTSVRHPFFCFELELEDQPDSQPHLSGTQDSINLMAVCRRIVSWDPVVADPRSPG